jgi:hypothetical protein
MKGVLADFLGEPRKSPARLFLGHEVVEVKPAKMVDWRRGSDEK